MRSEFPLPMTGTQGGTFKKGTTFQEFIGDEPMKITLLFLLIGIIMSLSATGAIPARELSKTPPTL
jgi:hypothetical protein